MGLIMHLRADALFGLSRQRLELAGRRCPRKLEQRHAANVLRAQPVVAPVAVGDAIGAAGPTEAVAAEVAHRDKHLLQQSRQLRPTQPAKHDLQAAQDLSCCVLDLKLQERVWSRSRMVSDWCRRSNCSQHSRPDWEVTDLRMCACEALTCRSLPLRCVMWSQSCSASRDMKLATTAVSDGVSSAAAAPPCAPPEEDDPAAARAATSAPQESRSSCCTREMIDTNWSWKLGRSSCASACTYGHGHRQVCQRRVDRQGACDRNCYQRCFEVNSRTSGRSNMCLPTTAQQRHAISCPVAASQSTVRTHPGPFTIDRRSLCSQHAPRS